MTHSDGFPIDAQRAIEQCATLITQSIELETAGFIESRREAARLRFEAALAAPIRARNARVSPAFTFPNELWVATWAYLPTHDRFIVSHVCHAWREVALSAPTLWTEIIPAYQLKPASGENYWLCNKCGSTEPQTTVLSPLAAVGAQLDRSGGLPICLRVSNHHDASHPEYLRDLNSLLVQNKSRITELHISVGCDTYIAFNLLDALETLPALRTLTVSMTEEDPRLGNPTFEGEHGFPALESLTLSTGLSWGLPLELPCLRSLSLAVYNPYDLFMALRSCPALHSLRIIPRFEPDQPWDAALTTRLSAVRDVCIDGMQEVHAHWFARSAMPAPGARVRLVYPASVPSSAALRVLRAFAAPVHALCAVDAGRYILELSDASRALVLEWPLASGVPSAWDSISPTSIEADPGAWLALLSGLPPGVRRLTLRFHSEEDVSRIALYPDGRSAGFPALTELTVRAMQPGIDLPVESITALREQLHLPARVRLLRISGLRVLGDGRELGRIADETVYGSS